MRTGPVRKCLAGAAVVAALGLEIMFYPAMAQAPTAPPTSIKDGYATVPGARLWYRDTGGSGQPVVFLHAATGSSQVWEHQIPSFTAAGYRFIAYDRRGFGRSTQESPGPQPGTGADDLHAFMTDLGIDRFHLVSTAAGGFIGLDYAVSFPQRLRSLVVANTMGLLQDEEFLEMGRRIRPPEFNALPIEFKELSPSYRASNPEGTRRWLELERTNRPSGGPPVNQGQRNRMTSALLGTIAAPTLLIAGESDPYMPPPVMRLMASKIKNVETTVIPETSHSAFWEQPEIFNRVILAFLRKHSD